ncbi:MAG: S8 family serine peptidase [Myxococcota bacterium]
MVGLFITILLAQLEAPTTIVRLDNGSALAGHVGAEPLGGPFYRVAGGEARSLRRLAGVRWAVSESKRRVLLDQRPLDPSELVQWHLHNNGTLTDLWPEIVAGAEIGARVAWTIDSGDPSIVVAVLDGGIPADHPDLPASARVFGWDFVDSDDDPSPVGTGSLDAHGTAVAGLAVGARNGRGIVGVCPECRVMSLRVLAPEVTARDGDLVAAILFAAEHADVITASWSFDPFAYVSPALHDAIRWAAVHGRNGRGSVIVFSAGNRGSPVEPFSPQAMIETLTVAATDERDWRAGYSNTGPSVSLAAPGGVDDQTIDFSGDTERLARAKIVTADLEGDAGNNPSRDAVRAPGVVDDLAVTASFQGTSASAPQVAGAAALLLSLRPELTAREVGWLLTETAAEVGTASYSADGRNDQLGYGRLDIGAAMTMARDGGYCTEEPERCTNGTDDDCDRLVDGDDPDCGAEVVRAFEVDIGAWCEGNESCGDGFCAQPDGRYELRACTADCDFDCPDGGVCVGAPGDGRCMVACMRQTDCLGGTSCVVPDESLLPPGTGPVAACLPMCNDHRDCARTACRDGSCSAKHVRSVPRFEPPPKGCDCRDTNRTMVALVLLFGLRPRRRRV